MKRKRLIILLPALLLMCSAGCQTLPSRSIPDKLVPFTAQHLEDFGEFLGEIQFFISRQIVLHRTIESETKDVAGTIHTIQVEKDVYIKSITFPAKTPGVLSGFNGESLNIQFEAAPDGGNRSLPFRPRDLAGGGGKPENTVFVFDQKRITYDGSDFEVHYEVEAVAVTAEDDTIYADKAREDQGQYITKKQFPILLINPVRKINRYREENRVVPGVWEPDSSQ